MGKITNFIKRAVVSRPSKDNEDIQKTQIIYLGQTKNIEVLSSYGLNSNPPKNSLVILLPILGDSGNPVGIVYDPRNRVKNLKEGEVVTGNTVKGTTIEFPDDGSINIVKDENTSVRINADGSIDINSTNINLGQGGPAIARVGDTITGDIFIPGGSSAGTYTITLGTGIITSGSTQNTSA